jgi:hypothetical protein
LKRIIARQAPEIEVKSKLLKKTPIQTRKIIVSDFRPVVPARTLMSWVNLSGSIYYYKSKAGKRGVKLSTHTFKPDGSRVENQVIIEEIKDILSQKFCYGYENIIGELRKLDCYINEKKVYLLMVIGKVII